MENKDNQISHPDLEIEKTPETLSCQEEIKEKSLEEIKSENFVRALAEFDLMPLQQKIKNLKDFGLIFDYLQEIKEIKLSRDKKYVFICNIPLRYIIKRL